MRCVFIHFEPVNSNYHFPLNKQNNYIMQTCGCVVWVPSIILIHELSMVCTKGKCSDVKITSQGCNRMAVRSDFMRNDSSTNTSNFGSGLVVKFMYTGAENPG